MRAVIEEQGPGSRLLRSQLEAELVRGRRTGQPVTVIVLVDAEGLGAKGRRPRGLRDAVRLVKDAVRRYDLVVESAERTSVLILAPDTAGQDAHKLASRLSGATGLCAGWACFPHDERTGPSLVSRAELAAQAASVDLVSAAG